MSIFSKSISNFRAVFGIVAAFWVVHFVTLGLPWLRSFGIHPRDAFGLIGVVVSPFLHGDFQHLLTNSGSFLLLSWLFLSLEKKNAIMKMVLISVVGGLGTWMIGGSNTNHIGASGLIYGMMGYLAFRGYYVRSIMTMIVSILVFFMYGYAIFGVFPGREGVSWEGHLSGFLAGIFFASHGRNDLIPINRHEVQGLR